MAEQRTVNSALVEKAIQFALNAHHNMVRKGSDAPYILHPVEAAIIVATITTDPEILAATILHDTVEDSEETTIDEIEREFGTRIGQLVADMTEEKEDDAPGSWRRRKAETIDFLKYQASEEVKIIALGDKLSNIRVTYYDQQQIGDLLWDRFNQKDKAQQGWYYRSLADALSSLSEYPVYQDYVRMVEAVFDS